MRIPRVLTGMILACGLAGTVQAASLLASDPGFGGPFQRRIACVIFNASDAPITFLDTAIWSQFQGSVRPLSFNGCVGRLDPKGICSFQAIPTDPTPPFACTAVIAEAKTNVRGTMLILSSPIDDDTDVVLSEIPMR